MQFRRLFWSLLLVNAAFAAEPPAQSEVLHAAQCVRCHDSTVYTRPDHKVTTLAKLESQVRACDVNLNLGWFDEDILGMVDHLNQRYYHFKP